MKVLVACEFSGRVRDAFARRGHDAWSCDLLPSETPGNHIQGDVTPLLKEHWDLLIAHPPCTFLCSSGARWVYDERYPNRAKDREGAVSFFMLFANAQIERIAIENPIGIMSTRYKKPTQIIQPYYFGEPAAKTTCLWLKNLPKLNPTHALFPSRGEVVTASGRTWSKWFYDTSCIPYKERGHERSKTFQGIAEVMAEQWGSL